MSTIVFQSQEVSDKRLLKTTKYRYHPDAYLKSQIIQELQKHLGDVIPEKMIIEIEVSISLKEYDLNQQPEDKNQWYQESLNTKKVE